MSRLDIYVIEADGEVARFGEAHNAGAGAPHIWKCLAEKYKVRDPFDYMGGGPNNELWQLQGTGKLTPQDDAVLAFTFDSIWVRRERIPKLIEVLEAFWSEHPKQWSQFDKKWFDVVPTVQATADVLKLLLVEKPECRGVCFNQTSVCSNPWWVRSKDDEDEGHPYVFGRDTLNGDGKEPHEILGE